MNGKQRFETIRLGIATKQTYLYEIKRLAHKLKKEKPDRSLSIDKLKILYEEYRKEEIQQSKKEKITLTDEERAAVVQVGGLSLLKKVDKKTAKKIAEELKKAKEKKAEQPKLIKKDKKC